MGNNCTDLGADGADTINGGDGNDAIYGVGLGSHLNGDAGNDTISPTSANFNAYNTKSIIDGGSGSNTVSYALVQSPEGADNYGVHVIANADGSAVSMMENGTVVDTMKNVNNFVGSPFNDVLDARNGPGGVVAGGAGNDVIAGSKTGYSWLLGGDGDDGIVAGNAPAWLDGGWGNDTLIGGNAADVYTGDGGNDTIWANNGVADSRIDCGDGTDRAHLDSVDPAATSCEVLNPA